MSQIQRIEEYAKKLREYCDDVEMDTMEILQIVKDIGSELITNISEENIDNASSVLLKSDGPIQQFFKKCGDASSGDLATATSEMLKILCTFLKKRRRHKELQTYAKDLISRCLAIATTRSGNAISKSTAIEVLTIMLDLRNNYDTNEFDVLKLYKIFNDQFIVVKTSSIKAKIIELLGTIARYFPTIVDTTQANRLKSWCFDNLTNQLKYAEKVENTAVTGYLTCLNSLLHRQDNLIQQNTDESKKLFVFILTVLLDFQNTNRYSVPIAALILFKEHSNLLSSYILLNYERLYDCLFYWASHHNPNSYRYGLSAYEEFIKRVSIILYENIEDNDKNEPGYTTILTYFMNKFDKTLEDSESLENIYHVSVAIRSFGYFSKIVAKKYDSQRVEELRNTLVRISEWFYSETNANQKEYIRHLPAFIKSYTSFAEVFEIIPVELMDILHRMCDIFILSFSSMSGYHRRNGSFYVQQLLCMLYSKGESVFRNFTSSFFEKTLICTCTNIISPDKEDRPAYTELKYFWNVVLNASFLENTNIKKEAISQDKDVEDIEAEELYKLYLETPTINHSNLPETIYDSFISAFMSLISIFNLKLKKIVDKTDEYDTEDSNEQFNTVSKSLRPVNQKDFVLFQNIVDFWSLILKEIDNTRLSHWIYIFTTEMIDYSAINPLVSGFYRIISEVLGICEKSHFFYGCKAFMSQKANNHSKKTIEKPSEFTTYLIIREYLKEVWHRLQQFTDELLASCLKLILAYPTEFFDAAELITPLEKALRLGITYHPLATIAMDSLDKILEPSLGYEINDQFLSRILPCINEYLLVGVVSFDDSRDNKKKKQKSAPSASQRRYEAVRIKMTSDQLGVIKRNYAGLPELQRRMMQFLGRLGGKNKQLLSQNNDSIGKNGMLAWDSEKKLKIRIPFMNVKVDIYLDEFLPRICELAESSSDRQVKIAACELLHGLVIYMIGYSAFRPKSRKEPIESFFHKFYLKVFPVMLKLATDPDQIARDMYQLLLSQIIHWLTSNALVENLETIALSKALLKAACDSDAGLRDYGADCLNEFVKWSIKQTSRSTDSAHNIKSLLRRLYNLMDSPSSSKRFGAALVFNRIYRLFREESVLVNMYTFEILGHLFLSLKIAETDHPSVGTRDQIVEAISHIKRIIREKSTIFLKDNGRLPFANQYHVTNLVELVNWSFVESGKMQRTYAKVCINFFVEFVKFLPNINDGKHWFQKQIELDKSFLESVFEPTQLKPPSIKVDETHVMHEYLNWIKHFNSTIDGYIWTIERNVVDINEILERPVSYFINAMSFFIKNPPAVYLKDMLEESVIERNKILSIYNHIAVRLVYFFDMIFSAENGTRCYYYVQQNLSDILYHSGFTDIIANALILPKNMSEAIQLYQGNAVTQSGMKRIMEVSKKFIITMQNKLDTHFLDSLASSICKILQNNDVDMIHVLREQRERSSYIEVMQTIDGIKFLQSTNLLSQICRKFDRIDSSYPTNTFGYCVMLFDYYLSRCKFSKDPLELQITGSLIVISFSQPQFAKEYAEQLLSLAGPLQSLKDSQKLEIFQKHIEYMSFCMTKNFDVFSTILTNNINSTLIRNYIFIFLEFLKKNRISHRESVWKLTSYLENDPSFLKSMIANWTTESQCVDLINCLILLFGADPGIMSRSKNKLIFKLLWDCITSLISVDQSYKVKNSALDLLPVVITMDSTHLAVIEQNLKEIINSLPPGSKRILKKGTNKYNETISILNKLLSTMLTFKSVTIFKLLIPNFVQRDHVNEASFKNHINEFSNGLGLFSFREVTKSCFGFFKDQNYLFYRRTLAELIITFLTGAKKEHVIAFYEENIGYIMGRIQEKIPNNLEARIPSLKTKESCLRLIQAFYELLPKESIDKGSSIDNIWCKSDENKIFINSTEKQSIHMELIVAYKAMRQDKTLSSLMSSEWEIRRALLGYNQAVLNSFLSFAVRIVNNEAIFISLFKNVDGMSLWDHIIDTNEKIHLELELDQPLVNTKLKEIKEISRRGTETVEQSISYMASIALTGSSLTQSSFSDIVLGASQQPENFSNTVTKNAINEDIVMMEIREDNENQIEEEADFEIDYINQNTCMRTLTETIQKIHNVICPPSSNNENTPVWMSGLLSTFESTSVNKKVYIAKLITNFPDAFEKYARIWIVPIIEFIIEENFGDPINYLVQDLCIILIVWGKEAKPSVGDSKIITKFLEFLIKNSYNSSPRIIRSNIQIIKGVFENWNKVCRVPTRAIYEKFNHPVGQESKNIIGLQVAGIVFSNGADVYDLKNPGDLYDLPEITFYTNLATNLYYRDRKSIDIPADTAELMSWSLKFLKEKNQELYLKMKGLYKQKLIDLGISKDHTPRLFLKCMNRIYLHDLEFGQDLFEIVSERLSSYNSDEKVLALNFMDACWRNQDTVYINLRRAGLHRMFASRDENLQIASLKIVNKVFDTIKDIEVKSIFNQLVKVFPNHPNNECRSLYYCFTQLAYNRNLAESTHKKIKSEIFTGLIDKHDPISSSMFEFIVSTFQLNDNIRETLLKITSDLYATDSEDIYLLYATRIILNNAKKTYDFNQPIFDQPLDKQRCDANYQKINTSWFSTSSMTPLFITNSQPKQINIEDLEVQLRKTQSLLEFSVTQGQGHTLVSTFNPSSQENADIERIDDSMIKEQSLSDESGLKKHAIKKESPYYKKRFFKESRGLISRFHADRNEQLQKKLRNLLNAKKEAGEKRVVMTRSYRAGEIPDVQIKLKELLLPLEVISTRDYNISRLLYSSLSVSIVNEIKEVSDDDVYNEYKNRLIESISQNLKNSQLYFTPTIGSFLRIIFDLNADVSSAVIKHVSDKSHNHHIGIAILENQILQGVDNKAVKRKHNSLDPLKEKWIYLSLLYQNIDELEIFENIYLTKVASNQNAIDGIQSQIKGDFALAFNSYDIVERMEDVNEVERNLWQEQMRYCRIQLTQWELLARDLKTETNNDFSKLWIDPQDPRLDYFIRSFSKFGKEWVIEDPKTNIPDRIIWDERQPNPIYKFLDDAYEEPNHRERLLNNFACEWSMVEIFRKNYSKSKMFINRSYDALLSSWTTLHPLAYTSRLKRLAQLQKTVELDDYLLLHRQIEVDGLKSSKIQRFLDGLVCRYPDSKNDSMDIWYDTILSRFEYIDDLKYITTKSLPDLDEIYRKVKIDFVSSIVNTALVQHNMTTLSKFLKLYKELNADDKREIAYIKYFQYECVERPAQEKVKFLGRLLNRSIKFKLPTGYERMERYHWSLNLAQTYNIIKYQLINNPNLFNGMQNDTKFGLSKLSAQLGPSVENEDAFINYLENEGFNILYNASELIEKEDAQRSEYLWKFGNYCDESLHALQEKTSTLQPDIDPIEYTCTVIKSYFEAMDLGHKNATDNFPRLLELIEMYPETGPVFIEYSTKLETSWKLIRWIPQLVSLIAEPGAKFIYPILKVISHHYPKALYLPFRISCETYDVKKHKMPSEDCQNIEKILHMIRSPLMEQFTTELMRLSEPANIIKDFINKIKNELMEESIPKSYVESKFQEFYQLLLNNYSERLGKVSKSIAVKHASMFLKYLGENGSNIPRLTSKQLNELGQYCEKHVYREPPMNSTDKSNLKSYSPWLNSFRHIDHDEELEIPGQYTGLVMPNPDLHIKIVSIDSKISEMRSMRKPKRICFYGSNDEKYHFLVKGGEDLRLDERIVQLFTVMNDIVKKDSFCANQNIQIATYKVIPMTTTLGIIEWVNDTITLGDCIYNDETTRLLTQAKNKYLRNLNLQHSAGKEKYFQAYSRPRETIVNDYIAASTIPPNTILRDFLFKLASSPEAFLFLRKDFAYSLACISIFGYILGIGDRHLQNFLLDMNSGRLIPIDFGYSFGASAELIAIPEISPFRLTRQLIGALEPIGVFGILEHTMTNLLSALQSEKELLLNIMGVFVKDPLMDWTSAALRENKQREDSSSSDTNDNDIRWYPQRKLDVVKQKLNGINPSAIVISELYHGHGSRPYYNDLVEIAKGDIEHNFRCRVEEQCRNANEQVKCLIDLATDKRALGVTYHGWQSYV